METIYILSNHSPRGKNEYKGTLEELVKQNKDWLDGYLPSRKKYLANHITKISQLVRLLNISYESTYWSDVHWRSSTCKKTIKTI